MADQLNGNEGEFIHLDDAVSWTERFRSSGDFKAFAGKKAFYVGQRKVLQLLGQADAVGFRAYFAVNKDGDPQMAIVAVDKEGNDILHANKGIEAASNAMVLDVVRWCPPLCDDQYVLGGN